MQVTFSLIVIVFDIFLCFWNRSHYLLLEVQTIQDKIYRFDRLRNCIQSHAAPPVEFFCKA